jgi:hypothetical protein
MELSECPHCHTRVVVTADGVYPCCRRSVHDRPEVDKATPQLAASPARSSSEADDIGGNPGPVVGCALIFVGLILIGVFLNLYMFAFSFLTGVLLGIKNAGLATAAYYLCLAGGIYTTYVLLRPAWRNAVRERRKRR